MGIKNTSNGWTLVYEVTLDQLMGLLAPLAVTHKLNCIKRIREIIPEYGLKEAKDLTDLLGAEYQSRQAAE